MNQTVDLTAVNKHQELDSIIGTITRVPRLLNAGDFPEWK